MDCIKTEHEEETNSFSLSNIKVEKVDDEIQDSVQAVAVKKEIKAENDEEIETSFPIDGGEIKDCENVPKYTDISLTQRKRKTCQLINADCTVEFECSTIVHEPEESACVLECWKCKIVFADRDDFQTHLEEHSMNKITTFRRIYNEKKSFTCRVCSRKFVKRINMLFHMETHEGKHYYCEKCVAKFVHEQSLRRHISQVHANEIFKCRVCEKCFALQRDLDQHMDDYHDEKHHASRRFECNQCERKFEEKSQFVIHRQNHVAESPFTCKVCGAEFPARRELYGHLKKHAERDRFLHTNWFYKPDVKHMWIPRFSEYTDFENASES